MNFVDLKCRCWDLRIEYLLQIDWKLMPIMLRNGTFFCNWAGCTINVKPDLCNFQSLQTRGWHHEYMHSLVSLMLSTAQRLTSQRMLIMDNAFELRIKDRALHVIISTWLSYSSLKLPTASRNFLSERFCNKCKVQITTDVAAKWVQMSI